MLSDHMGYYYFYPQELSAGYQNVSNQVIGGCSASQSAFGLVINVFVSLRQCTNASDYKTTYCNLQNLSLYTCRFVQESRRTVGSVKVVFSTCMLFQNERVAYLRFVSDMDIFKTLSFQSKCIHTVPP